MSPHDTSAPADLRTLTAHYGMVVVSRGKHRADGGGYVFTHSGELWHVSGGGGVLARRSAEADSDEAAAAELRELLLSCAREAERRLSEEGQLEQGVLSAHRELLAARRAGAPVEELRRLEARFMGKHQEWWATVVR